MILEYMTFPVPQHTPSNVIDLLLSFNHTCTFKISKYYYFYNYYY